MSQSNPLFSQNLALWVIFSQFGVKGIEKVENFKELWVIMEKNLQNDQIGHFEPILPTFLTKFAIVGIFSQFGVKGIQKVEKLKKFSDVPSPQKCKFLRFQMK